MRNKLYQTLNPSGFVSSPGCIAHQPRLPISDAVEPTTDHSHGVVQTDTDVIANVEMRIIHGEAGFAALEESAKTR